MAKFLKKFHHKGAKDSSQVGVTENNTLDLESQRDQLWWEISDERRYTDDKPAAYAVPCIINRNGNDVLGWYVQCDECNYYQNIIDYDFNKELIEKHAEQHNKSCYALRSSWTLHKIG